jgi:uncharacterized membrane protein
MSFTDLLDFTFWAAIIEFIGALLITGYILAAVIILAWRRDITQARYLAATGILAGLNFKLAGTLLKLLHLQTWQQIMMFSALFVLRTVLKRFFTWEQTRLTHKEKLPAPKTLRKKIWHERSNENRI